MVDLLYFGGPILSRTFDNIEWRRPTKVLPVPRDGMANNAYFFSLPEPKVDALFAAAGIAPEDQGSFAMTGFSAAHSFMNPMLKTAEGLARTEFVLLQDSCFLGEAATEPHQGYVEFAKLAMAGKKRMVATSNGPAGANIAYSGPDGTQYRLTSGAKCVQMFWDAATGSAEGEPVAAPPGAPEPTFGKRIGELYFFHYETAPKGENPHSWHSTVLSPFYMQEFGVPWMAGERPGFSFPGSTRYVAAVAGAALGYWAARELLK